MRVNKYKYLPGKKEADSLVGAGKDNKTVKKLNTEVKSSTDSKVNYTPDDYIAMLDEAEGKSDTTKKTMEYSDAYQLQKEYIEKYLSHGEFDASADDTYNEYHRQALEDAKALQRETTAQAAGLTGGYASSYALALGADAAADYMSEVEPALYEAALARHTAKGAEMLDRADVAGAYGDILYQESPEYAAILAELEAQEGGGEQVDYSELEGISNAMLKLPNNRRYGGWFNDKSASEFINWAVAEKGYSDFELRELLSKVKLEDFGDRALSEEEIDYLVNMAGVARLTGRTVEHNGTEKSVYEAVRDIYNSTEDASELIEQAKELGLSYDEIYFIIENLE